MDQRGVGLFQLAISQSGIVGLGRWKCYAASCKPTVLLAIRWQQPASSRPTAESQRQYRNQYGKSANALECQTYGRSDQSPRLYNGLRSSSRCVCSMTIFLSAPFQL